jgi:hypothetical protein
VNSKLCKKLRRQAGITRAAGNKHVLSRYQPVEVTAYLPDGYPVKRHIFVVANKGVHAHRHLYRQLKREARAA